MRRPRSREGKWLASGHSANRRGRRLVSAFCNKWWWSICYTFEIYLCVCGLRCRGQDLLFSRWIFGWLSTIYCKNHPFSIVWQGCLVVNQVTVYVWGWFSILFHLFVLYPCSILHYFNYYSLISGGESSLPLYSAGLMGYSCPFSFLNEMKCQCSPKKTTKNA